MEAALTVAGELPDFPHLPELPARGPGADMIGRTAALLPGLPIELRQSKWRLTGAVGVDQRRAEGYLRSDLDVLEEVFADYSGPLKVQLVGPWTLAASLELPRGHPVLSDPGAVRDVVASLAEAAAAHIAAVARRVPAAHVILQLDEPSLPLVLAGQIPTVSGMATFPAVEESLVESALVRVKQEAGCPTLVHCCAAGVPVGMLTRAGFDAISLDLTLPRSTSEWEELAQAIDAGTALLAGVVPATETAAFQVLSDPFISVGRELHRRLVEYGLRLLSQLGAVCGKVPLTVTPACGVANASQDYARLALGVCRELGNRWQEGFSG